MTLKSFTPGALALALVASWLALRPSTGDPERAAALERGRAHVAKTCGGCHAGAALDAVTERRIAQGPDALAAFLASHFVPDAPLRADVVAYLEARVAAAARGR